jgi:hypothetical protein
VSDIDYGSARIVPDGAPREVPGFVPAGGAGLQPEPDTGPTFGQTLGAAFRQENAIVSALGALLDSDGSQAAAEPDHNPLDLIKGTPYEERHLEAFVGSQSAAETRRIMRRIDREEADRKTLRDAGGLGIVASMGAGILDPTILIPGAAVVRGANGARVAASALLSGVKVGAGAAVQEGILQASQEIRPWEESALAIGGATILGGILGGAMAGLSRREAASMGAKLDDVMKGVGESDTLAASAPAAAGAAPVARGSSAPVSTLGVEQLTARLSPVTRLQTSPFEAARTAVRDLAEAAVDVEATRQDMAQSAGGAVETRAKMWLGPLAEAVDEGDKLFARYFYGKDAGFIGRMTAPMRSEWAKLRGTNGGKLTAREFREEVGRAMRRNDEHPIPEVAAAAKAYRKAIFDPLKERAVELGVLPEGVTAGTAPSYLTRVYNHERVVAERPEFKSRIVEYLNGGQQGARRQIDDLTMKRDFEAARIAELEREASDEAQRFMAERAKLRAAQKAMRPDVADARAEMEAAGREATAAQRQADKGEARVWRDLLRDVQRGRGEDKIVDLVDFVRGRGGFRLVRYDALGRRKITDAMEADFRRTLEGIKKRGVVNNRDGLDPDKMLVQAIDGGYLPPGSSVSDLIDAIGRNVAGERVFSDFDSGAASYAREMADLRAELERAGLNPRQMKPEDLAEFFGRSTRAGVTPEVERMIRAAADATGAFDAKAARLDEIERLLMQMDEASDDLRQRIKDARTVTREKAKEVRAFDRQIREAADFADLSPAEIAGIVDEVIDQILGMGSLRLPGLDIVQGPKGPLKERTLQIPDEEIEDFLVSDVEHVARVYTRTMAGEVELVDKFGSVDLADVLAKIGDEANAAIDAAPDAATRTKLSDARVAAVRDVEAMRDRVRHAYAIPDNLDGFMERAGRTVLAVNTARLLGGATVSSIADPAYTVARYGLGRTLRDGWAPFIAGLAKLSPVMKEASRELKMAGTGAIEMVLDQRFMDLSDLAENWGRRTRFEKAIDALGARFGMVSLLAPWTATMKTIAGMPAMNRLLEFAEAAAGGKLNDKGRQTLAALGIDEPMADRIWRQFSAAGGGDVKNGFRLPNTEAWTDRGAKEAFRAAIVKDVDMAIVSPGLEKPLLMSKTWGKVLFQFKSFALASTQRVLLSGMSRRDAAFLNGVILSIALGSLAAQSKAWLRGEDTSEWSTAKHIAEAVDYSGVVAILMEANNTTEKITRGRVGISALTGEQMSRYQSRGAFGSLLGPTFGLAEDAVAVMGNVSAGEMARSDLSKLRRMLPYQNLFYLRQLFDMVEDGVGDALGLPKRRPR